MTHYLTGRPQHQEHIAKRVAAKKLVTKTKFMAMVDKKCTYCHKLKSVSEFHKSPGRDFQYKSRCISCCYAESREWKLRNSAKVKQYKRDFQESRRELRSAYQQARECGKLNRTPAWANKYHIAGMYELCGIFRRIGVDMHVDHIVPLKGKFVSGLHVENNLQLLPSKINMRKKNIFEVAI